MNVKIESDSHGYAEVYVEGVKQSNVRSINVSLEVSEANTVTIEYVSNAVVFEGEVDVIALIDGKRYKLMEGEE